MKDLTPRPQPARRLPSSGMLPAALPRLLAIVPVMALAACATGTPDTRYDSELAPWKGASAAKLQAGWGRPLEDERPDAHTRALTWVTRRSLAWRDDAPQVAVSQGRAVVRSAEPPRTAPPSTCLTRFVLVDDAVVSWSFQGTACGAGP